MYVHPSVHPSFLLSICPKESESQQEGHNGLLEGSKGMPDGSEGLPEETEGLPEGSTRPIAISRVLCDQRRTDGRTDRPTNKAAYRVAYTRLKSQEELVP